MNEAWNGSENVRIRCFFPACAVIGHVGRGKMKRSD